MSTQDTTKYLQLNNVKELTAALAEYSEYEALNLYREEDGEVQLMHVRSRHKKYQYRESVAKLLAFLAERNDAMRVSIEYAQGCSALFDHRAKTVMFTQANPTSER